MMLAIPDGSYHTGSGYEPKYPMRVNYTLPALQYTVMGQVAL